MTYNYNERVRTYHHIRYAEAARFAEPELMPFDESMLDDYTIVSCPQNKFRLEFIR